MNENGHVQKSSPDATPLKDVSATMIGIDCLAFGSTKHSRARRYGACVFAYESKNS